MGFNYVFFKKKNKKEKQNKQVKEEFVEEETVEVEENDESGNKKHKRVYHVAKREKDGMWQVRYAGGNKAIKLFKTKAEAVEYTKKLAENQGGVMLQHNSKGMNKGKIAKKN